MKRRIRLEIQFGNCLHNNSLATLSHNSWGHKKCSSIYSFSFILLWFHWERRSFPWPLVLIYSSWKGNKLSQRQSREKIAIPILPNPTGKTCYPFENFQFLGENFMNLRVFFLSFAYGRESPLKGRVFSLSFFLEF